MSLPPLERGAQTDGPNESAGLALSPPITVQRSATFPPVLALRVVFRAAEPQRLPPFLGSALHGALGRALHRVVCAFPRRDGCRGCPLEHRCAYTTLFAPPAPTVGVLRQAGIRDEAPRPLILGPEAGWTRRSGNPIRVKAGMRIPIRVTLVGSAARDVAVVIVALRDVARRGLGLKGWDLGEHECERASLELAQVVTEDGQQVVYDGAAEHFANVAAAPVVVTDPPNELAIDFVTPIRLKLRGKFARTVKPADLYAALARRALALDVLYGSGSARFGDLDLRSAAEAVEEIRSDMHLVHVCRYSSSQRRRMSWPGLMGSLTWRGDALRRLWPLLGFGELVQVGKATAFGFGRYHLRRG